MNFVKFKISSLLILLCVMRAVPSSAQNFSEAFQKSVNAEVEDMMGEGDIPGLSVILIKGNQSMVKGYGYADLESEMKVSPETLFEIGSCSKAFTGLAITQLEEQGLIKLTDNVSKYLSWFKVSFEGENKEITIGQLLHHTSGIPWQTIADIPESNDDDALEKTINTLVGTPLANEPGSTYEYATINYDILALMLETVTGKRYEAYMSDHIFNKLDMSYTSVGQPVNQHKFSKGYKIGFFEAREYNAPTYKGNNAAGYIISNAVDMQQWLKFQLGQATTELNSLIKLTHQRDESVSLHGMSAYARGWHITLNGSGEIYHDGVNPNFTAYIAFRPKENIAVAILANSNSTYTAHIGDRLIKIATGEELDYILDPGDGNDKLYSGISIAIAVYIIITLIYLVWVFIGLSKGQRTYNPIGFKTLGKIGRLVLMTLPFAFSFYILPEALVGFNWQSILVWSPVSFAILIGMLTLALGFSYIAYSVGLCFPEQNQYKSKAPMILLMSILSGLSNVIVIIMVTSAIGSDMDLKYQLMYYGLTLSVYLLGRRFVQINLIRFTRGLVYDFRIQLIEKIFSTSYQKFERMDRGRVYTALNDDVNTIGQSTGVFSTLVTSIITAIGAFVYLASIAFWATLVTIFLIFVLSVIYYIVSQSTNIFYEKARDERNIFMTLINGMIDGFKEISLHRNKKLAYKRDVAVSADEYRRKISTADIRFVNAFLVGESLLVVLLGIVAFGIPVLFPDIELYTLMSFVVILLYLMGPINTILSSVPALMQLNVAYNRLHDFISEIPANLDLSEIPMPLPPVVDSLVMENVTFSYRNGDNEEVFGVGPINLQAHAGEILFVIGGNGSGKTTFAKLITGLYEPDGGVIKVNGRSLRNAEISEYFSTVFSPTHLFEKLYSIDVGDKKEKVDELLKMLRLDHKVEIKDNSYSTINLSGGQRKRLALLQCYLEDSPIYLFDEWAADQDPEYRNFFYRTLLPEMRAMNKVVIAITHDDHYFDVADKVMKMNQGKLEDHFPQRVDSNVL